MNKTKTDIVKTYIRDVPDFPKPGIIFKDITPVLSDHVISNFVSNSLSEICLTMLDGSLPEQKITGVAGIESRGFLFGMTIAQQLKAGFIPVRKAGKLPYHKISKSYELEYGTATIEMHEDAIEVGANYIVHDDLLATGGTAAACAELIQEQGGHVIGFCFVIELDFLNGREKLLKYSKNVFSLLHY